MNYIMLPAYNEGKTIGAVLAGIRAVLEPEKLPFSFIICDDGSSDNTVAEIGKAIAGIPILLMRHEPNRGIGQAFRTLFSEAARISRNFNADDIFIVMESDRTSDPALLPKMIKDIQSGCDVVCASRYRKGGGYYHFPWRRFCLSVCANLFLKIFFGIKGVRDYTIFYRGYSSRVLSGWWNSYTPEKRIEANGFAANAEILIKLRPFIRKIAELPLCYRYDLKKGKSKMKIFSTIHGYLFKDRTFLRLLTKKTRPSARPSSDSTSAGAS